MEMPSEISDISEFLEIPSFDIFGLFNCSWNIKLIVIQKQYKLEHNSNGFCCGCKLICIEVFY